MPVDRLTRWLMRPVTVLRLTLACLYVNTALLILLSVLILVARYG